MEAEDDLDILTALLAENEAEEQEEQETKDDLDDLFDNDDDDEEYTEGAEEDSAAAAALFGDVDDIEEEEEDEGEEDKKEKNRTSNGQTSDNLNKSKEDLEDELKRMQEKMQRLQQQLEASQKSSEVRSNPVRTPGSKPVATPRDRPQTPPTLKTTPHAGKTSSGPGRGKSNKQAPPGPGRGKPNKQAPPGAGREESSRLQESSDFSSQLSNADMFKPKGQRTAHQTGASTSTASSVDRVPLVEIKMGSTFLPVETSSKVNKASRSLPTSQTKMAAASSTARQTQSLPALPKDVAIEKYSGLRLRRPRVSSTEMDRKMADRRLIRLSQLPERVGREKLEESDWVTFAVLVNKATPQSNSSGKTFSIWKLTDLHNLEVFVSLFLFGDVHKEHWKTEPGTVIGILNPNLMKPKEGYDGVSLSIDHPQKVMLLGEAQDYGTCQAMKKNGDPCSQIVNMYECQYCQYHVKAQYKKMSSQRAELQSSYSGKVLGKVKGRGNSLKERLCQTGFHYGGVSSAACAASLSASHPKKPTQTTLSSLFIKGSDQLASQAKKLALSSNKVSGCSDDFKSLLSQPTSGALQLKKHLTHTAKHPAGPQGSVGGGLQSISASELLKQQKQQQQQLLESRKRRAEEIQKRVLQNSGASPPGRPAPPGGPARRPLLSPRAASEVPRAPQSPATPTLGRGFTDGDDILFYDHTPPPPPSSLSLSAAKLAALKKLRAKGEGLAKEDPNAVKRKRSGDIISARVESNLTLPDEDKPGPEGEEPAQKKRRENLDYIQSEEFQKILNAKSRHGAELQAAEYQLQERYFDPLVKKEQLEEKMRNIREMKCRAVTCRNCKYTYFKPADRCKEQNHQLQWHDALKRFFKCPCGQRAIALDRLPNKHCSNCGLFKWERDGMLKEKAGPKIAGELLQPRGEEQAKFLSSMM
ncbi:protein MCM10 homolog isoform X2 [Osmerus eperlanus]|uniref:protein MCM10 homolog isoform X2 n=1 Tax=Osmerus eperlanus TaxID=29151 RepID=UPI002E0D4C7C